MRTAPGRGPNAEDGDAEITNSEHRPQPRDGQLLAEIDADIEAAEEYERFLALKCYRVRKLILNLKIKRDALEDFGRALWRNAA